MFMKKILPLFVLALILSGCSGKLKEEVQSTYDNGQPKYVKYYTKSGECVKETEFYEDGAVKMEGAMHDGHREGEWKAFFPDGKPQSIGSFKDGLRTGSSIVYNENGNKMMEGDYFEGKHAGVWKYYDDEGNLIKEVDYGKQ